MAAQVTEKNASFMLNYGAEHHKQAALNSPDKWVRWNVAYHTNDEKHLDHLIHDSESEVRGAVVRRGRDRHLNLAIGDHDEHVRANVASTSDNPEHLHTLAHDSSYKVRHAVAMAGHHHETLMHDPEPVLRRDIANVTDSTHVLKHLANDEHESVVKAALLRRKPGINQHVINRVDNDPSYHHYGKNWIRQYAHSNAF